jgi:hypothetical protein
MIRLTLPLPAPPLRTGLPYSISDAIPVLLAMLLLLPVFACGGGGTSPPPSLVSLQVTPAKPSLIAGDTQQFEATGTFSDGSTQDLTDVATWSSSSTTVASVSNSGFATTLAIGTTTIKAVSGSMTASTPLTVRPMQISSLSETTANSFDSLTITGTGFDQGTLAISVLFVPENGAPSIMVPVSASDSTSIQVLVPTFTGLTSGSFTSEIVDVQIVQFSSTTTYLSNRITGLQVNALPALPGGIPVGAVTAALLTSALHISEITQIAEWAPISQFDTDLAPLISAVNTITNDPTQTVTLTTANGTTTTLDAQTLALSDQLAQALVAAIVKQGSIPAASSSNCPAATGDTTYDRNLCSMQIYFQTLAGQFSDAQVLQGSKRTIRLEISPPQSAVSTIYANLALGTLAELSKSAEGAEIYTLVAVPLVTTVTSALAVNQDTPAGTDAAQGTGLTFFDNAFFQGVPYLSVAVDEIMTLQNITTGWPPKTGTLISSGAAGLIPGGVTVLDPNTSAPPALLEVPVQTQAGIFASSTLVIPPPTASYTLTLNFNGAGNGWIYSFPTGTSFPAGTIVGLTAVPDDLSSFFGWSGAGGCGAMDMCIVTMNQNHTVSAGFDPLPQIGTANGGFVTYIGGTSGLSQSNHYRLLCF